MPMRWSACTSGWALCTSAPARVKLEARALLRLLQAPSGKDARHLAHILLGVAAIHAERMQLHQLSRVVFVESGDLRARIRGRTLRRLLRGDGVRAGALPVVEVVEHRGMLGDGGEQVFKFAEGVAAQDVTLVGGDEKTVGIF